MNPAPPFFSVSLVGKANEHLERLTERAEQLGLEELLAATYGQIIQTLETWPREWGDPSHNYRGLNATAYQRAIAPAGICVVYAVHNAEPVVWIYQLVVLEDSPFA